MEAGTTELVSVASDGTQQNGSSSGGSTISADGRYVAFHSWATNLVPGDTNYNCALGPAARNCFDVFVHDRETGTTERVSVAADGAESPVRADGVWAITADGRQVTFSSAADNLIPGDTNEKADVFVRDRGPATGVGAVEAQRTSDEVLVSGWASFSGVTIASAEDSPEDAGNAPGAEIKGASVIYRPEQEGLLLRLWLASLPSVAQGCTNVQNCQHAGTGALPGVAYRFGFEVEGTRYEVRALRESDSAAGMPPLSSRFSLHKCTPECAEIGSLSGGIGTTGAEARVAVPLAALTAGEGTDLTDIEMLAETPASPLTTAKVLDEVSLPDAPIPITRVELATEIHL